MKQIERQNRPTLEEVLFFFEEEKWEKAEAGKFFFHYEMNGWLAGNKNPIRDWKAAAQKWILNTSSYKRYGTNNTSHQSTPAGKLQASTGKNYSEPL